MFNLEMCFEFCGEGVSQASLEILRASSLLLCKGNATKLYSYTYLQCFVKMNPNKSFGIYLIELVMVNAQFKIIKY